MAIQILKQKAKTPEPKLEKFDIDNLETMEIEKLADSYGSLEDKINALMQNPIIAQFELVKKALSKKLEEGYESTDTIEVTGEHWELDIGAAAKAPAVIGDMALLRKYMGDQTFMACASISLKDAKDYLTPEQLVKVMEPGTKYTTRRKVVAKFIG